MSQREAWRDQAHPVFFLPQKDPCVSRSAGGDFWVQKVTRTPWLSGTLSGHWRKRHGTLAARAPNPKPGSQSGLSDTPRGAPARGGAGRHRGACARLRPLQRCSLLDVYRREPCCLIFRLLFCLSRLRARLRECAAAPRAPPPSHAPRPPQLHLLPTWPWTCARVKSPVFFAQAPSRSSPPTSGQHRPPPARAPQPRGRGHARAQGTSLLARVIHWPQCGTYASVYLHVDVARDIKRRAP